MILLLLVMERDHHEEGRVQRDQGMTELQYAVVPGPQDQLLGPKNARVQQARMSRKRKLEREDDQCDTSSYAFG